MSNDFTRVIELKRGSGGLGFNINGGIDDPYLPGDNGIFVTKIREHGAAFADGNLEVNDAAMDGLKHNQAVNVLVNAGQNVKLKIIKGAALAIKARLEAGYIDDTGDTSPAFPWTAVILVSTLTVVGYITYRYIKQHRS